MKISMFDLSLPKLLVLAVLALVVFGPRELPKIAAQFGRAVRDLRRIADSAQADLREGLGPEFSDFDLDDLNPRASARIRPACQEQGRARCSMAGSSRRHGKWNHRPFGERI
jgi:Sec-independent protein translocase protein TatA